MKKYVYPTLVVLVLVVSCGSVVISSLKEKKMNKENLRTYKKYTDCSNQLYSLNNKRNLAYKSESRLFPNILLGSYNNDIDSITIESLVSKPRLVYRFYEGTCVQCIENELDIVKQVGGYIGESNILLIYDGDVKSMKAILLRKKISSPYFTYKKRFNLPFDQKKLNKNDVSTFFVLDTNLRTDMVYVAGGHQDISMPYFERIKQYFIDMV